MTREETATDTEPEAESQPVPDERGEERGEEPEPPDSQASASPRAASYGETSADDGVHCG